MQRNRTTALSGKLDSGCLLLSMMDNYQVLLALNRLVTTGTSLISSRDALQSQRLVMFRFSSTAVRC